MEARLGLPPRPFLYMGDEPPHLFSGHTVLPEPDFHRLDRASFAWRTRTDSQIKGVDINGKADRASGG
jgi:hypothetical protein